MEEREERERKEGRRRGGEENEVGSVDGGKEKKKVRGAGKRRWRRGE